MSRKSEHNEQSSLEKYQSVNYSGGVLQRMMQATGAVTQTELACHLEVGKAAISDAKRRNIVPAEWFLKLCRAPFHINPLWLESGSDSMHLPGHGAAEAQLAESIPAYGATQGADIHVAVPVASYRLLGGGELEVSAESPRYCFHREWLARRGEPTYMKLMRVMGDAMRPTLLDGDHVLVDESQRDVFEGSVYVLGLDGQVVVKRLAKRLGSLLLISENKELYAPLEVPFPSEGLLVVGRVIWASREL